MLTMKLLNDLNLLLGIDFTRKFKVSLISYLDDLIFSREKSFMFVKEIHSFEEESKKNTRISILMLFIDFDKA